MPILVTPFSVMHFTNNPLELRGLLLEITWAEMNHVPGITLKSCLIRHTGFYEDLYLHDY